MISRLSKAIQCRSFNRKLIVPWNVLVPGHSNNDIQALQGHRNTYFPLPIHGSLQSGGPRALKQ